MNTILSVTPTNYPNQRNFKINGNTADIVLYQSNEGIFINSIARDTLSQISAQLGILDPTIIDIKGRERQYGGLSGYILKTNYKKLSGGTRSIKALFKNKADLLGII